VEAKDVKAAQEIVGNLLDYFSELLTRLEWVYGIPPTNQLGIKRVGEIREWHNQRTYSLIALLARWLVEAEEKAEDENLRGKFKLETLVVKRNKLAAKCSDLSAKVAELDRMIFEKAPNFKFLEVEGS
jgi:hypothetical protein